MDTQEGKEGEHGTSKSTSSTPATTPPERRLYNDVLHSIFAFLIDQPHLSFNEFIASARTCTRWMQAAATMQPVKRNHQAEKEDEIHMQATSSDQQQQQQTSILSCDSHRLELLCRSRLLRHHVNSIRYYSRIFSAQIVREMAEFMPHLQQLQLDIEFDASSPVDLSSSSSSSSSPGDYQPAILLPESLRQLTVNLRTRDFFSGATKHSEVLVFNPTAHGDEMQINNHAQCGAIMQALADGIEHSWCKDFISIACSFETHQSAKLPSCALRPLMSIESITHLIVSDITIESCDLIREWHASGRLKRFDIVSSVNETTLGRLIGTDSTLSLPPLRLCDICNPTYSTLSLLARFSEITDLQLVRCNYNPDQLLLAHLPSLRKFCWRPQHRVSVPDLVDGIIRYASQLEYLELRGVYAFREHQLGLLTQNLERLRSLTLGDIQFTLDLSSLLLASDTLQYLNLNKITLASRENLKHVHRIRNVTVTDCEFLAEPKTTPAPRLVGIELNPGPTAIDRLYVDVLHSIYSFIDTQNYREFTSPARTCKSWFEAAVTMKFPVPPSINYDTTEPPLRSESLVARSQRQITAICTSRLRQVVTSMRLLPVTSTAGLLDELKKVSVLMPHLRKLHITVQISNKHSKLQFDSTDHHHHHHHHHQQPLLPSLLKSLVIDVISLESYSQQSLLDEKMTPSRSVLSDHIIELMDQLSFFARTSCPHLVELELMYKEPIYLQYLPAALLATWNRVSSLRHLRVKSPSLQCADVMRTMNQLRCIDGITTHEILKQLVKGTPKLTLVQQSTEAAAAAVDPSLPLLRSYRMSEDEHYIDLSLLAHFPHLTSLRLNNCDSDPGPILFVHLPQLKRLTWYEQALHPHTMRTELISIDDVLTSIRIYAPQLEYLQLAHPHLSQSNPQYQELLRSISNMKHLNKQNSAPTPIATHHLSRL